MPGRFRELLTGAVRTLREEGPSAFGRRVFWWLRGVRRYHGMPSFPPSAQEPSAEERALAAECARLASIATRGPLPIRSRPHAASPLISVLVRTQNRPHLLRHALHSLAMQEAAVFEVVVVNDGGEDVAALLHEFEPYFPIQYLQHAGPRLISASTNTALAAMRGRYFVHLDDDDIVYPQHLASFAQAAARAPEARVLYCNHVRALLCEEGGRLRTLEYLPMRPWSFDAGALLHSNFIAIHATLFHREIYDTLGGYDLALSRLADWDYLIRASRQTAFMPLEGVTCEYRFYLETAEAHFSNREPTLKTLRQIYARYPTSDAQMLARRAENLAGIEAHLVWMRQWQAQVEQGAMTPEQMRFAILRTVAGFRSTSRQGNRGERI